MHDSHPRRECKNRGKRFPAEPLTSDEVKRLLRACSQRAPTGLRNRALLALLYRGGLRLSEALGLYTKDIDFENGAVRVLHGKGGTSRLVGLDSGALALVQLWLERRAAIGPNARSPLFCTLRGEEMKTAYVRALLPRLARKANIQKRVHAHGLRHSFAYELANEGTPLHVIQASLGHRGLETTQIYLNHLAPTAVVAAMKSREWTL